MSNVPGFGFLDVEYSSATGFSPNNEADVIHQKWTSYTDNSDVRVRCSSNGGSSWASWVRRGALTSTVLWTNSSPTSTFDEQNITLSQSYRNFSLIMVRLRRSTSETPVIIVIIPATSTAVHDAIATRPSNAESRVMKRGLKLLNDSYLGVLAAHYETVGQPANDYLIPTAVYGLR